MPQALCEFVREETPGQLITVVLCLLPTCPSQFLSQFLHYQVSELILI